MIEEYVVVSASSLPLDYLDVVNDLFLKLKVPAFYYGDNGQGLCCFVANVVDSEQLQDNLERLMGRHIQLDFSSDFEITKNMLRDKGYCPRIYH